MIIKQIVDNDLDRIFIEDVGNKILEYTQKKLKVNLFLSGGSVVDTYSKLSDILSNEINKEFIHFYQIDERYNLDPLHSNSNQAKIKATSLYTNFHRQFKFILNGNKQELELKIYENVMKSLSNLEDINIAILGVGTDCHIAGIKPRTEIDKVDELKFNKLFLNDNYVIGYLAADFNRISLTLSALKVFNSSYVYIKGGEKLEALKHIYEDIRDFSLYPAQFLQQMNDVRIYTDIVAGLN